MSVFTNPAGGPPSQAAAYLEALLELLGERDPLHVLGSTPSALAARLDAMTEFQLLQPEALGKWSVRHVLAHLADAELAWGWRLRLVLAQDRPTLTAYDQDRWADRLAYDRVAAQQALLVFSILREANLGLLSLASAEDLTRVGVHTERGEQSVEQMMRHAAGHDLLHLQQIDRIRRAVAGAAAADE